MGDLHRKKNRINMEEIKDTGTGAMFDQLYKKMDRFRGSMKYYFKKMDTNLKNIESSMTNLDKTFKNTVIKSFEDSFLGIKAFEGLCDKTSETINGSTNPSLERMKSGLNLINMQFIAVNEKSEKFTKIQKPLQDEVDKSGKKVKGLAEQLQDMRNTLTEGFSNAKSAIIGVFAGLGEWNVAKTRAKLTEIRQMAGLTNNVFYELEDIGEKVSKELSVDLNDILDSMKSAIKRGIPNEEMTRFLTLIEKFRIATGLSSSEAVSFAADMRSMGLSYETQASRFEYLKQVTRATSDELVTLTSAIKDNLLKIKETGGSTEEAINSAHILQGILTNTMSGEAAQTIVTDLSNLLNKAADLSDNGEAFTNVMRALGTSKEQLKAVIKNGDVATLAEMMKKQVEEGGTYAELFKIVSQNTAAML